ncbi:hypothetical protein RRG08_056836 [Elysia crispata]|uniref:Uncharacterized protein n=1 Tax=Elysia crispata TaxID=231223 RepID=A0AAE1ACT0_9GAST|nr:hypothetical protein RRG08_056836 [Elysia crispata]
MTNGDRAEWGVFRAIVAHGHPCLGLLDQSSPEDTGIAGLKPAPVEKVFFSTTEPECISERGRVMSFSTSLASRVAFSPFHLPFRVY